MIRIRPLLFLYIGIFLNACGAPQPTRSSYPLQLHVQLPAGLTDVPARRQRFEARVASAEIRLTTKRGATVTAQLAPGQWDSAVLPNIDFPKDPGDGLTVRIQVWDRTREGRLRSYPVLSGRAQIAAQELSPVKMNAIAIRLSLKVSVHDYDL